jgi:DNA-binding transcriptional ArsR family regulator
MGILEELTLNGPLSATELGERLGESPANCSWHLRKLADHRFVEEVPDSPGRARPWRAVTVGLSWDDEDDSEAGAAARELSEALLAREVERLRVSRAAAAHQAHEWRAAGSFTQSATWMTAAEATELSARISELLMSYSERLGGPGNRPEGARLVSLVGWLAPRPEAPAPSEDQS